MIPWSSFLVFWMSIIDVNSEEQEKLISCFLAFPVIIK
ncbi:hypothetical protein CSC18_1277 [Klebsiella aerogenes]|nr:hypothetical protein CSC18_1277 [Klebsiella aerogenes]